MFFLLHALQELQVDRVVESLVALGIHEATPEAADEVSLMPSRGRGRQK